MCCMTSYTFTFTESYSFRSSNRIRSFVYTSSGIFLELQKVIQIVTYAWWFQEPHSHFVSPFKYLHLFRCSMLHVTPVCNMLRHLHAVQGLLCPFPRLSSMLTAQLCDVNLFRHCHSLQRVSFTGKSAGRTKIRKHSLSKSLSEGSWSCRK